jgi:hypothetical protein
LNAQQKREKEIAERALAEAERAADCKTIYDDIWRAFDMDRKKGKSFAYTHLQSAYSKFASYLVPTVMSETERMKVIMECEQHMKEDMRGEDPRELMASWIRGEIDLSRTPLEKSPNG